VPCEGDDGEDIGIMRQAVARERMGQHCDVVVKALGGGLELDEGGKSGGEGGNFDLH
jgi:hypothetical protein